MGIISEWGNLEKTHAQHSSHNMKTKILNSAPINGPSLTSRAAEATVNQDNLFAPPEVSLLLIIDNSFNNKTVGTL